MPLFFLDNYFTYLSLEKRYSPHTLKAYTDDVHHFVDYISSEYSIDDIKVVRHIHVRSWLVHLSQNNIQSRSLHRKVSSLKSYFKYLKRKIGLDTNPMQKIVLSKMAKHLPKTIRETNMTNVLNDTVVESSFKQCQDDLIVRLFYETGIRRSELLNLLQSDINKQRKELKILGKGNKVRLVPISRDLLQQLDIHLVKLIGLVDENFRYVFCTPKGKKLYPKYVYNLVQKYLRLNTSVGKAGPHILRHSFATHLADNGADINAIKELLGHAGLVSTQIYTHNSVEKLKRAYKNAHPKAGGNK